MSKYKVAKSEITKTGKFLKMPRETQALYFHLLLFNIA